MSEEMVCRKRRLSSFQIIILGFAGVILLGALLLMLPLSTTAGCVTPFHEALFTATSAVCVTGLVVQDTGSYWSASKPPVGLLSSASADFGRFRNFKAIKIPENARFPGFSYIRSICSVFKKSDGI